jgi:hypothetical protein
MPVGGQSAILAKTLFINRFPSLPPIEQTQGIRVGGCGFQMIKEGFRQSVGFGVFSVTATPPCATHNSTAPQVDLIHSRDPPLAFGAHASLAKAVP